LFAHFQTNDDDLDVFMERLNLKNENSEFWRKRFTGEDLTEGDITESDIIKASMDTDEDAFTDDEEEEDEDEDVEAGEEADYLVEDGGEIEETEPPGMLAMQLLKNKKDFPEKVVRGIHTLVCWMTNTVAWQFYQGYLH
jgi:hypothetical protein